MHTFDGPILSVPGTRLELLEKAFSSGAPGVVVDLEDAVASQAKDDARARVVDYLSRGVPYLGELVVRVNPVGSPWCHQDLLALGAVKGAHFHVMLPKTEGPGDLEFLERLLEGIEIQSGHRAISGTIALVESARGLLNLETIAQTRGRLRALAVGYADLSADLGRSSRPLLDSWSGVRERLITVARAYGLAAIDGPYLGTDDGEALRSDTTAAVAAGFDAKWVIHPRQVASVAALFAPSAEELSHARRTLAAYETAAEKGTGAVELDGRMLDLAVAEHARRTIARSGGRHL